MFDAFDHLLGRFGQGVKAQGQSLDLLGIEDGVFLEIRNLLLGFLSVIGLVLLLEGAGVNDGRAILSPANASAEIPRLLEGQPNRQPYPLAHRRSKRRSDIG